MCAVVEKVREFPDGLSSRSAVCREFGGNKQAVLRAIDEAVRQGLLVETNGYRSRSISVPLPIGPRRGRCIPEIRLVATYPNDVERELKRFDTHDPDLIGFESEHDDYIVIVTRIPRAQMAAENTPVVAAEGLPF